MNIAWRFAWRELRGGVAGLRLLAICLFLGVAGLAGVASLSSAIVDGLNGRGQAILGGDIEMRVSQRQASPAERAAFARIGTVSESVKMRAMVSTADAGRSVLGELKGVDGRWPLYGDFRLQPGALARRPDTNSVAIAPALAERLSIRVGDTVRLGEGRFRVIGLIAEEPDSVGEGFALGPTILTDMAGISASKLIQPGSLFTARYRIRLNGTADAHAIAERLEHEYADDNWEVSDRTNAARGLRRFVEQFGQFLTLVGLTALVVAGIGVGNGVTSWLDQRRGGIATLKILGASSRTIFLTYLIQIMIVAAAAIVAGLIVGAAVPTIVGALAGDALPAQSGFAIHPSALLVSAAYGLFAALLFSLAPLARAGQVSPAAIFRARIDPFGLPPWPILAIMALSAIALFGLAVGTARDPALSAMFLGGALAVFLLLGAVGWLVRRIAAALPRPKRPLLRLALANLHRPGAQTDRLVVALGLGLTLFATMAVVETNLAHQMQESVPKAAPNYFALDIPTDGIDRFREVVRGAEPKAVMTDVPSLRGSVVAVRGQRVADMHPLPKGAWILNGDRGLTYAAALPDGNEIIAGQWWPADYAGPPLVSIEQRAADSLALKIGDSMTFSVLGVEIDAKVASIRKVNWETMGFNFGIVFAPGALEGAPHSYMATVTIPDTAESRVNRAVVGAFPSVSLIRIKDVIGQVASLFGQMSVAVRSAASVTLAAGIAVLIGAIAASRRARTYDSVLLKLLGASRRQVLFAQAIEYALLALVVALLALAIGTGAGWYIVTQMFGLSWAPDWTIILGTLGVGALATLGIGLAGSLPALNARPAQVLRTL